VPRLPLFLRVLAHARELGIFLSWLARGSSLICLLLLSDAWPLARRARFGFTVLLSSTPLHSPSLVVLIRLFPPFLCQTFSCQQSDARFPPSVILSSFTGHALLRLSSSCPPPWKATQTKIFRSLLSFHMCGQARSPASWQKNSANSPQCAFFSVPPPFPSGPCISFVGDKGLCHRFWTVQTCNFLIFLSGIRCLPKFMLFSFRAVDRFEAILQKGSFLNSFSPFSPSGGAFSLAGFFFFHS